MSRPSTTPRARLCIAVKKDGITVYANSAAILTLVQNLQWMNGADPKEHYECHVSMTLDPEGFLASEDRQRSVWVLVDRELSQHIESGRRDALGKGSDDPTGFELTFMAVTETDLDRLAKHQASGILPSGGEWE